MLTVERLGRGRDGVWQVTVTVTGFLALTRVSVAIVRALRRGDMRSIKVERSPERPPG